MLASTFATLSLLCLAGCNSPSNSASDTAETSDASAGGGGTPVTLQLNWFPEAEHGGYYAALVHGHFASEGIDVEIQPGGPNVPVVQSVAAGRVSFAVTNADRVLFGHQAGAKVVALMAPIQHTPRCVMVHRESGIEKLEDLKDVTLAVGTGPAFYQFMQKRLSLSGVQTIAYPGSLGPFLSNKQFAQQAYVFSEPFLAKQQGADPVSLMLSDIGYDPYASVLIANPKMLAGSQRSVTERFVRACLRGWETYTSDPAETNAHILSLNKDMTSEALTYGATVVADLCAPGEDAAPSAMSAQRWQTLIDQLDEIDLVDKSKVKASDVFDGSFVAP